MSTTPHNPRSGDDFDPWQDLEADLFGKDTPKSSPPPEPEPAPPQYARPAAPVREPVSEPPRETHSRAPSRQETPVSHASFDAAANEEEEEEDDDVEEQDEDVEDQDEEDSEEPAAPSTAGKKPDSYWDALANWNWDEADSAGKDVSSTYTDQGVPRHGSGGSGGRGGRSSGPPPRSGGQGRGRGGERPERTGGPSAGRGRSERSSGSPSSEPRSAEPRSAPPARSEAPAHRAPPPPPPAPVSKAPVDDVWDDFGAGVESSASAVEPASDQGRVPPRGQGTGNAPRRPPVVQQGDATGDDPQKRRRRRRRRRPGEEGPGQVPQQNTVSGRGTSDRRTTEEYEDDEDVAEGVPGTAQGYDEPPEQAPAGTPVAGAPADRQGRDRPRGGRRRRRGGSGRKDRPTFEQTSAPRAESVAPAGDDFEDEEGAGIESRFVTPAETRGSQTPAAVETDVELIDYGDMPTWEEAISYLLHPDQVELDPNQQSANVQRRAQAQEEGRSGSRHYGKRRP